MSADASVGDGFYLLGKAGNRLMQNVLQLKSIFSSLLISNLQSNELSRVL